MSIVFACFTLIDVNKVVDKKHLEIDDYILGASILMTDNFLLLIILAAMALTWDVPGVGIAI